MSGWDQRGDLDDLAFQQIEMHVHEERRAIAQRAGVTWRPIAASEDGAAWQSQGLRVIWSVAVEQDGRVWLHVSASRPDRLPSYADMQRVYRTFVGERFAYSVWAPSDRHISIHDNCLHLWCKLEGEPPLPDFARGGSTI